ncbi:MAG: efflux RND transporter periplasmic adaptor subunit [Hyphomicrobiales bacterium]|nr:efflux RND transporter periplasmic adaptor subunit [Hyphomicrobiales bacterium]
MSTTPRMSTIRFRRLALSVVFVAAMADAGSGLAQQNSTEGLRLVAPETGPEIRAQLTPRQYTTLSSEIAGRIDKINTKLGDHFKKGDNLIAFDCVIQRAQVARAQAVAVQAEKTYGINQRLLALKSIGQLELDVSAAEVQKSKADLASANAVASKCSIDAPFNGVTVEQRAREFQYASPGQPLLDILDDRSLEVELIAPSRWLSWLQPGYVFAIHIDETGKDYRARITRIGGRVDPVSQSIKVVAEITDEAPELIAGMSGRAMITAPH